MEPEKEKSLGHNVRKYFREYSEVTGIQGLRYVAEKRSRCEKVVWTIVLILSLCGCIYMIFIVLEKYVNTPVIVSFSNQDTPVYEIPFPAVTICPEPKYSRAKFDYTEAYKRVNREEELDPEEAKSFDHLSLLCDVALKDFAEANKTVEEDIYDTYDNLKLDSELLFTGCSFDNKEYKCEDLLTPVLIDGGICYSFNTLDRNEIFRKHVFQYKNYNQVVNTSESFDVEWGYSKNAGINSYPRRALESAADPFAVSLQYFYSDSDRFCNTFYDGFMVIIHNAWDIPQIANQKIQIAPGKIVLGAVLPDMIKTSKTVRRFSPEKRQCYMKDERYLQHFKFYSQPNCLLECLTNFTLNYCECVSFAMPRNKTTPICGPGSMQCLVEAKNELKHKELEYRLAGKSFCDCKPACTKLIYNVETTSTDFLFKEFYEAHNIVHSEDRSSFSVLQIFFENDQFLTAERTQLYGISDLISNLGGLLGLFTGFSLITAVEIIYFCTLRIFYNVKMYGVWSGPPS